MKQPPPPKIHLAIDGKCVCHTLELSSASDVIPTTTNREEATCGLCIAWSAPTRIRAPRPQLVHLLKTDKYTSCGLYVLERSKFSTSYFPGDVTCAKCRKCC